MKKRIKYNPAKEINDKLIYDLANAFYFGNALILASVKHEYNQGQETCEDCGELSDFCECEKCEDCGYKRCLCDIDDKSKEETSKAAAKFAKKILNDKQWTMFNYSIHLIRENYKKIYGYYLDEKPEYWGWWKK